MDFEINWSVWIPSLIASGFLGLIWFDIRSSRKKSEKDKEAFSNALATIRADFAESITKLQSDFRAALYYPDGRTLFIPRVDCESHAAACQALLCGKIDEIKAAQREADRKRESARSDYQSEIKSLKEHVGRVEQYMKDHG